MSPSGRGNELVNRRTITIGIFILWITALAWLVDRHFLGDHANADTNPRWPVPPGSAFLTVNLTGQQIGLSTLTVDTLLEGLRVTDLTTIDLPRVVADTPRRSSQRVEALYTRGLQLIRFQSDLLTEQGRTRISGRTEGDSALILISISPTLVADTQRISLRRPVVLPAAVPLVAASRGLPRPGSRLNIEIFDPIETELRLLRIKVAAESVFIVPDSADFSDETRRWSVVHSDTVRGWRLDWSDHGLPVQLWVDGAGLPVRIVNPLGAVLDRSAFEIVQTNFRMRPPPSYETSRSAPLYRRGQPVAAVRSRMTAILYLVPDQALPRVPELSGGWQRQVGDTLLIGPGQEESAPDSAEDEGGRWSLAAPDSTVAAAAHAIAGSTTDPLRVSELLAVAVRKRIHTLPLGEARTAAPRVLAMASGTEQEQVNLFVALANSAGLRARPVWGLIQDNGAWVLRAWAEVWVNGWVPIDPAAPGHDAGRIRLATSGNARLLSLVLRTGRLRASVLEETK